MVYCREPSARPIGSQALRGGRAAQNLPILPTHARGDSKVGGQVRGASESQRVVSQQLDGREVRLRNCTLQALLKHDNPPWRRRPLTARWFTSSLSPMLAITHTTHKTQRNQKKQTSGKTQPDMRQHTLPWGLKGSAVCNAAVYRNAHNGFEAKWIRVVSRAVCGQRVCSGPCLG